MNLYWVSAIVQNEGNKKPWLCAMNSGVSSIEIAMEIVNRIKRTQTVLSIWVDTFNEDGEKTTVYHDCYINAFGNIMPEVK